MAWYYKDKDQEIGPVSKQELQALIKAKRINGQTLVRSEGNEQWRPLVELVKGQKKQTQDPEAAAPQPPQPPQAAQPEPPQPPKNDPPQTDGPLAPDTEKQIPFRFGGTGGEYFKIWIVNVVLSVLTLGIYSAWAKVRRKQYFYGNTSLTENSFRYLADPVKILKGRLIVFAFFVVSSMFNQFFPPLSIFVSIALFFVVPYFVVRSLAFNARNSSWRNIRFNFTGTYGAAAMAYIVWPILGSLTLGILIPFAFYKQKKFIVENSSYGRTYFKFNAVAKDYYAIVLRFIIPVVILCAVGGVAAYFLNDYFFNFVEVLSPLMILGFILVYLLAFVYFSVKFSNLLYNSAALMKHRFKSTMLVPQYAWIVISNTIATVLTIGLFHPFAQVRAFRYKISNLSLLCKGDLDNFVATELKETSALGDEMSDFLDFDFGL